MEMFFRHTPGTLRSAFRSEFSLNSICVNEYLGHPGLGLEDHFFRLAGNETDFHLKISKLTCDLEIQAQR